MTIDISNSSHHQPLTLDVLIVGSGFSGIYQFYQFRKLSNPSVSVHIFDSASDVGGTWFWNTYPGARVDSDVPLYEFSLPELWKDWTWSERFPGQKELQAYFNYVGKKLDVQRDRDISFNTRVVSAHWNEDSHRWTVTAENGRVAHAKFLFLGTGFASMPNVPNNIKGLETFQGTCYHTARWPREKQVDMKGKRVGVIGTGASGVQVIQEIADEVEHLAVFQRTPNLAIAMQQRKLTVEEQKRGKEGGLYDVLYKRRLQTIGGFSQDDHPKSYFSATPEERRLLFEQLWARGGFSFIAANYPEYRTHDEVNEALYTFWREKVLARITDPKKASILAPEIPPHPFAAKRTSLEQTYYEVYNKSNVTLTDISKYPIEEITPKGVKTADGVHHELDILVLATGFDITATITHIDIRGSDRGMSLKDVWTGEKGVSSYLGMTIAGFPNLFYTCGPQAPAAFVNGPTCVETQCNWITECITYLLTHSITSIEPKTESEEDWCQAVWDASKDGPWMKTKGWYNNGNIPGRKIQPLNYTGGLLAYMSHCNEETRTGYKGFNLSTN